MLSHSTTISYKIGLTLSLVMILAGCGSKEFRRINSISWGTPNTHPFITSNTQISGSYALFNGKMSRNYLGRNVLKKGYQPIYITLTNHSHENFYFSNESIDIPTVSADEVAEAAHFSSAELVSSGAMSATGCAIGVPLMAFGAFGSVLGGLMEPKALLFYVPTTIGAGLLIQESAREVQDSMEVNDNIDAIFEERSLTQKCIPAHSTIAGVIFTHKKAFNPVFTITLNNTLNDTVTLVSK